MAWANFYFPDFLKIGKIVCCRIWPLGPSRRVQNTPTGCGDNLPTRQAPFREKTIGFCLGCPSNARSLYSWVPQNAYHILHMRHPPPPQALGWGWGPWGSSPPPKKKKNKTEKTHVCLLERELFMERSDFSRGGSRGAEPPRF